MRRNYPGKGWGGCFLDRGGSKVTDPDVKRAWNMQGIARMEKSRASICKLCYRSWTFILGNEGPWKGFKKEKNFIKFVFMKHWEHSKFLGFVAHCKSHAFIGQFLHPMHTVVLIKWKRMDPCFCFTMFSPFFIVTDGYMACSHTVCYGGSKGREMEVRHTGPKPITSSKCACRQVTNYAENCHNKLT